MADRFRIGPSTAGPKMNRTGKILVANPLMPLSNPFNKSVIYIYQDDDMQGTTGLVLNRQSKHTFQDLCADHNIIFPDNKKKVYMGGPVNPSAMVLLHTDEWQSQNTAHAGKRYHISSDRFMFMKMSQGDVPAYWRMHVGLSQWAPGQLDREIEGIFPYNKSHKWLTIEANDDILFEYDGEEQWNKALELCGKEMFDQYF